VNARGNIDPFQARKTRDFDVCWLLIHNIFHLLFYLPIDSQYSSPVEFTR